MPLGQPHRDAHDDEKREGERDERRELAENRAVAGQRSHRSGVLPHRDRGSRAMRRIAEIDLREPGRRDRDCADRDVIIPSFETLEDLLHLRDRDETVLAPKALRGAAPQIHADAVDRSVRLDMAIRRRVVDRDLERRVLGQREAGGDDESERDRAAPNEHRGGQGICEGGWRHGQSSECDSGLLTRQDEIPVSIRVLECYLRRKCESFSKGAFGELG